MRYRVRALDGSQQLHSLTLEALDEADARAQLQARGLQVLTVARQAAPWRAGADFALLLFIQELQVLLAAGLGVVEALDALAERAADESGRAVVRRLAADLRQGLRLSAALQRQPQAFPPLFVGLIQAAEGTSDLPGALGRYLDYGLRMQRVRRQATSAALYPLILLAVGAVVALFLMGYVVPRFAAVYEGTGRTLPWASQLLLDWGRFASGHAGALAGAGAALGAATVWSLRRGGLGRLAQRVLQRLPGVGERIAVAQQARLYLTVGLLLDGGIALPAALQLGDAVLAPNLRPRLAAVRAEVEAGGTLSGALERHRLITPIALRLLRVGEQSGQLGRMLGRAAAFHEDETARWIDRFSRAFEPVLMAVIGVVIGLIVILLYMPVFELAGSLS